jgi:tetratricopeptide (TPR) repeat protein
MASHVERMKKSRCYIESGKLSCINCHNPHLSVQNTPKSTFINACMQCHSAGGGRNECKAPQADRMARQNDCIVCHMPHNSSIDIPHVAVTDHYIRKRPQDDQEKSKITAFLGMQSFNNDHPDEIARARGFLEFYERYTQAAPLIDSALYHLGKQEKAEQTKEHSKDLVRAWFWKGEFGKITELADNWNPDSLDDAWTAYRIGESYYKQLHPELSIKWYKRAVALKRYALDFENKYGTCLLSLTDWEGARQVFRFILDQNPDYVPALTNMGYLLMRDGNKDSCYFYCNRARSLDPDYEQNLVNLAVWYHKYDQINDAAATLEHLLAKHPGNEQAKAMLQDLGLRP